MTVETVSVRSLRRALLLSPMFAPDFKTVGGVEVPAGVGDRARSLWHDVVVSVSAGDDLRKVLHAERERLAGDGWTVTMVSEVCDVLHGEYVAAAERVDDLLKEVARHESALTAYASR